MFKAPSRTRLLTTLASLAVLVLLPPLLHRQLRAAPRAARAAAALPLTLGVKTYVCDAATEALLLTLLTSVRAAHPALPVLLANDGPRSVARHPQVAADRATTELLLPRDSGISAGRNAMVNATRTPFFALLDDDHLLDLDNADLALLVAGVRAGFDIVGMRVRNLPGIPELESDAILIPRYVANVTAFENRTVTLCVWNENVGPSVVGLRAPFPVDVVHNAFVARTDALRRAPWRDELKVNEHMTFFLDAKAKGLRVGYLPSVFVHHRRRRASKCYDDVRWREDKFEKLLDYTDDFAWEKGCYYGFVDYVKNVVDRAKRRKPLPPPADADDADAPADAPADAGAPAK